MFVGEWVSYVKVHDKASSIKKKSTWQGMS